MPASTTTAAMKPSTRAVGSAPSDAASSGSRSRMVASGAASHAASAAKDQTRPRCCGVVAVFQGGETSSP
jgi:hypothetical protein